MTKEGKKSLSTRVRKFVIY